MTAESDEDGVFKQLLEAFENEYDIQSMLIESQIEKIKDLLPVALQQSNVMFQPNITHRMKTLESAKGSLERRRRARMERATLKARLEKCGGNWKEYWERRGKESRILDFGPFPPEEPLVKTLHDLGGIRILVYFPGHVSKTIDVLKSMPKLHVRQVRERGHGIAPDMYKLKAFIHELEGTPEPEHQNDDKIFAGYRATHAHVSLKGKFEDAVVEIQVTTVVMNAWSQVEHDIIYKADANKNPSNQEIRILDTFNGVVMVGENALKELESIQKARQEQADKHNDTVAESIYDIGRWIKIHCKKIRRINLLAGDSSAWEYLPVLFDVLKAQKKLTSGTIKSLIEALDQEGLDESIWNQKLPLYLIRPLHSHTKKPCISPRGEGSKRQAERQHIRLLASRVSSVMTLAAYLGILKSFVHAIGKSLADLKQDRRPTMVDFLDILHPVHSQVHMGVEENFFDFCERFLDRASLRRALREDGQTEHVSVEELPLLLEEMGLEAQGSLHAGAPEHPSRKKSANDASHRLPVVVLRELCHLLDDPNHAHWAPDLLEHARIVGEQPEGSFDAAESEVPVRLTLPGARASSAVAALPSNFSPDSIFYDIEAGKISPKIRQVYIGAGNTIELWLEENLRKEWEYHAKKQAGNFRPHPGHFRAVVSGDTKSPSWRYEASKDSQWKWRLQLMLQEQSLPSIKRLPARKDGFEDLMAALTPEGDFKFSKNLDSGDALYNLTINGVSFHLKSSSTEYIMHKTSFHQQVPTILRSETAEENSRSPVISDGLVDT